MKVVVTQPIAPVGINLLKDNFDVVWTGGRMERAQLLREITSAHALICSANDIIDKELIDLGGQLKVISNVAVGYNNIDIDFAKSKRIFVTNTPNTTEQSVVEFVFAHILALARRLVETATFVKDDKFKAWTLDMFLGRELNGKTLGIIGFGKNGQRLVPVAKAFGMNVLYTNQSGEVNAFVGDLQIRYGSLEDVLKNSDFVVLLVPLTDATRHLISKDQLQKMKSTAFLINMSRGPVVKEADLVTALREECLAGAGLDVFEFEPAVSAELREMDNVFLTPHIGSATIEARERMAVCAAQNVIDVLTTEDCKNIVNQ